MRPLEREGSSDEQRQPPNPARRLHHGDRPPHRRLAPPRCRGRRRAQYRPLSRARADRRARPVRPRLRRRQPGRVGRRPRPDDPRAGSAIGAFRAGDAVGGAVAGDRANRLRRHGVDDLRGSVSAGAQVRFARPHQQGPRRLERGDDRRRRVARISRSPGILRMPTATSGPRSSSISCSTSGTATRTTP